MAAKRVTGPPANGAPTEEFVEEWRNAAYSCFSSGHKFCREVCPVMQVTRDEAHTPTAFHANVVAMEQGTSRDRGRRAGLRPLHPVRGLRAALPEHALHRRLLPLPHAHGRSGQGDAGVRGRAGHPPARRGSAGTSVTDEARSEPVLDGAPVSQEHVADWAAELDLPVGGETILFCDCEAAFHRTSQPRAAARVLQAAGVEFGLMREQWCCGGPAAEMGYVEQARRFAEHNVADWRAVGATPDPRHRPARLHHVHRGLSALLRRRLRLRDRARRRAPGRADPRGEARADTPVDRTVTYHDACRLNKRKGIQRRRARSCGRSPASPSRTSTT